MVKNSKLLVPIIAAQLQLVFASLSFVMLHQHVISKATLCDWSKKEDVVRLTNVCATATAAQQLPCQLAPTVKLLWLATLANVAQLTNASATQANANHASPNVQMVTLLSPPVPLMHVARSPSVNATNRSAHQKIHIAHHFQDTGKSKF